MPAPRLEFYPSCEREPRAHSIILGLLQVLLLHLLNTLPSICSFLSRSIPSTRVFSRDARLMDKPTIRLSSDKCFLVFAFRCKATKADFPVVFRSPSINASKSLPSESAAELVPNSRRLSRSFERAAIECEKLYSLHSPFAAQRSVSTVRGSASWLSEALQAT